MKLITAIGIIIVVLLLTPTCFAGIPDTVPSTAGITLDGRLSDWTSQGIGPIYADPQGDTEAYAPQGRGDIKYLYLAKDSSYLYWAIQTHNTASSDFESAFLRFWDGPYAAQRNYDIMFWASTSGLYVYSVRSPDQSNSADDEVIADGSVNEPAALQEVMEGRIPIHYFDHSNYYAVSFQTRIGGINPNGDDYSDDGLFKLLPEFYVFGLTKSDGSHQTVCELAFGEFCVQNLQPDQITFTITDPAGQLIASQDTIDYEGNLEYYGEFPVTPVTGTYTLTGQADGQSFSKNRTMTHIRKLPVVNHTSSTPIDGQVVSSLAPSISWNRVKYSDISLKYRLRLRTVDGTYLLKEDFIDPETDPVSVTVEQGLLEPGQTYRYRIDVYDHEKYWFTENIAKGDYVYFHTPEDTTVTDCKINIHGISVSGKREVGSTVTVTVEADNSCSSTVYHRFSVHGGYGTGEYDGRHWNLMTDTEYTTENSVDYVFDTAGQYIVVVWAKNQTTDSNTNVPIAGIEVNIDEQGMEPYFPF